MAKSGRDSLFISAVDFAQSVACCATVSIGGTNF